MSLLRHTHSGTLLLVLVHLGTLWHVPVCRCSEMHTLAHFCRSSFKYGRCDKSPHVLAHRCTLCHPSACPSSHLHTLACSLMSLLHCPHSCTLLHILACSQYCQVQVKALPAPPRLGCAVGVWHSLGRPDNPARGDLGDAQGVRRGPGGPRPVTVHGDSRDSGHTGFPLAPIAESSVQLQVAVGVLDMLLAVGSPNSSPHTPQGPQQLPTAARRHF